MSAFIKVQKTDWHKEGRDDGGGGEKEIYILEMES